jgi:hypothetical protein
MDCGRSVASRHHAFRPRGDPRPVGRHRRLESNHNRAVSFVSTTLAPKSPVVRELNALRFQASCCLPEKKGPAIGSRAVCFCRGDHRSASQCEWQPSFAGERGPPKIRGTSTLHKPHAAHAKSAWGSLVPPESESTYVVRCGLFWSNRTNSGD